MEKSKRLNNFFAKYKMLSKLIGVWIFRISILVLLYELIFFPQSPLLDNNTYLYWRNLLILTVFLGTFIYYFFFPRRFRIILFEPFAQANLYFGVIIPFIILIKNNVLTFLAPEANYGINSKTDNSLLFIFIAFFMLPPVIHYHIIVKNSFKSEIETSRIFFINGILISSIFILLELLDLKLYLDPRVHKEYQFFYFYHLSLRVILLYQIIKNYPSKKKKKDNFTSLVLFTILFFLMSIFDVVLSLKYYNLFWFIKETINVILILLCFYYGAIFYFGRKYPPNTKFMFFFLGIIVFTDIAWDYVNTDNLLKNILEFYNENHIYLNIISSVAVFIASSVLFIKKILKKLYPQEIKEIEETIFKHNKPLNRTA